MQKRCFSHTLSLIAIPDTKKTSNPALHKKIFMSLFAKVALLRKEVARRKNTQFRKEAAGRIKCVGGLDLARGPQVVDSWSKVFSTSQCCITRLRRDKTPCMLCIEVLSCTYPVFLEFCLQACCNQFICKSMKAHLHLFIAKQKVIVK